MNKKNIFRVNLVKRRKELGLTQEQLALRLNVSPQAVSKWENSSYPDSELLPKLAKILNISLDSLFGTRIKDDDGDIDIEHLVSNEIRTAVPEKRSELFMRIVYSALCAYNPNSNTTGRLKDDFDSEAFAVVQTDFEVAVSRLNSDLRYCCFLQIPENGVDSYFGDTETFSDKNMIRLFKTLADENAIKIITYLGSGARNKMFSVTRISQKLDIPESSVQHIIDRLDRFGLVWRMSADISDKPTILYGYTHSVPLIFILVLAKSITNYLQFKNPNIELWTHGAFKRNCNKKEDTVPQVSWWKDDEL